MSDTNFVKWTLTVQVDGGPTLSATETLSPTAYQRIAFVLDKAIDNNTPISRDINLPPNIQLLVLKANKYDPPVTYKVDGASSEISLISPVIQFTTKATKLNLTNKMTTDAIAIEILLANDVTAASQPA